MIILRSILGVVVGAAVGCGAVFAIQLVSFFIFGPDPEKPFADRWETMQKMHENAPAMKAYVESMSTNAMLVVLLSWQTGAFLGGGVAGLIAVRGRVLHAGIIGGLVLTFAVLIHFDMKNKFGVSHPDWMIIAILLLPMPISLLAGKLVSMLCPPAPPSTASNP